MDVRAGAQLPLTGVRSHAVKRPLRGMSQERVWI